MVKARAAEDLIEIGPKRNKTQEHTADLDFLARAGHRHYEANISRRNDVRKRPLLILRHKIRHLDVPPSIIHPS
jgi:hypothetical protein